MQQPCMLRYTAMFLRVGAHCQTPKIKKKQSVPKSACASSGPAQALGRLDVDPIVHCVMCMVVPHGGPLGVWRLTENIRIM